jgi:hypothetical protein
MIPERQNVPVWTRRHGDEEWRLTPKDSWDVAAQKIESNLESFKKRCGDIKRHHIEGKQPFHAVL